MVITKSAVLLQMPRSASSMIWLAIGYLVRPINKAEPLAGMAKCRRHGQDGLSLKSLTSQERSDRRDWLGGIFSPQLQRLFRSLTFDPDEN
jgi:hypothetical protein